MKVRGSSEMDVLQICSMSSMTSVLNCSKSCKITRRWADSMSLVYQVRRRVISYVEKRVSFKSTNPEMSYLLSIRTWISLVSGYLASFIRLLGSNT